MRGSEMTDDGAYGERGYDFEGDVEDARLGVEQAVASFAMVKGGPTEVAVANTLSEALDWLIEASRQAERERSEHLRAAAQRLLDTSTVFVERRMMAVDEVAAINGLRAALTAPIPESTGAATDARQRNDR